MRILGMDYGEKRIGLAITDRQNSMALPFGMLENNESLSENILKLVKDNDIGRIVIGRPVNLRGQSGFQAEIVDSFVSTILKKCELPISIMDERFTSKISSDLISASYNAVKEKRNRNQNKRQNKNQNINKKTIGLERKSGATDTISAAIILGDYLSSVEINKTNEKFQ